MACCDGSIMKAVLISAGLTAFGIGAYNTVTTGCPLRSCEWAPAAAAIETAAPSTNADPLAPCCASLPKVPVLAGAATPVDGPAGDAVACDETTCDLDACEDGSCSEEPCALCVEAGADADEAERDSAG